MTQTKICCKCKQEKPTSEFFKASRIKDGYQSRCKLCHHDFKKYYQKNKEKYFNHASTRRQVLKEWVQEIKRKATCGECSEDKPWRLEFHHIDGKDKDNEIAYMLSRGYAKAKLEVEMKKCIVLCKNCHSDIHYFERNGGVA